MTDARKGDALSSATDSPGPTPDVQGNADDPAEDSIRRFGWGRLGVDHIEAVEESSALKQSSVLKVSQ